MCFDPYVLERITASRLNELRADAARHVALASLRTPRLGVLVILKRALTRAGRRFGTVRPRHA